MAIHTDSFGRALCKCGSDRNKSAIIDSLLLGDPHRKEPLIVVTDDAGHLHMHNVVITTEYQLTLRAALKRKYQSIRNRVWYSSRMGKFIRLKLLKKPLYGDVK